MPNFQLLKPNTMCGIAAYFGTNESIKSEFKKHFKVLVHRGPDRTKYLEPTPSAWFGFHRLAIMDVSRAGDQPFQHNHQTVVCNGEIYNYESLRLEFSNFNFKSNSDCEVLLPVLKKFKPAEACNKLDGEFAFIHYNSNSNEFLVARDPMGIRPLFYGQNTEGEWFFASELKVLHPFCDWIKPFPPGATFNGIELNYYHQHYHVNQNSMVSGPPEKIYNSIKTKLIDAVEKRLDADQPIGFLLSGGLDSSLVCAIAAKLLGKPIETFAIGMDSNPIDLPYAKKVAQHIRSKHTEITMTKEQVIGVLPELIQLLETYDITTVRASIGMYLLTKYIRANTKIRVLLTGEVSDELFGYKYTDFAPNAEEFQNEAQKRIQELYYYDVLRADRCIAGASLEARVPFSDKAFVDAVMQIDPQLKMNTYNCGKYLLRKAFEGNWLPQDILWRDKAAFSDAVGHSMVDYLKQHAEEMYTDAEFNQKKNNFLHCSPTTKEALLYREIFEQHYPGRAEVIPAFWMPNSSWPGCQVNDPSARVLSNYGKSGE